MRRLGILTTTSMMALFATACSGDYTEASDRRESDEVRREVAEAWDSFRAYTYEQRADLERKVDDKMAEWDRRLDRLSDEVDEAAGEAKQNLETRIDDLKNTRKELAQKLEELGSTTKEAWKPVRDGLVASMERMEQALEEAGDVVRRNS